LSLTTARLLGLRPRHDSLWHNRFHEIADRLVAEHGVPTLGNFRDPVKEIFYILLSARTTDAQYRSTNRNLRKAFPELADLARARIADIKECIQAGGLVVKRAVQIRRTAKELLAMGKNPSKCLKALSTESAFETIVKLPGMGPKSTLCVLMYSLGFDAFPVDVNVQRIAERMGAIPRGLKHRQAQRRLAVVVPDGRSRELHIAMVVHGRTICLPQRPKCGRCVIRDTCRLGKRNIAED
jgi:endonuclease III